MSCSSRSSAKCAYDEPSMPSGRSSASASASPVRRIVHYEIRDGRRDGGSKRPKERKTEEERRGTAFLCRGEMSKGHHRKRGDEGERNSGSSCLFCSPSGAITCEEGENKELAIIAPRTTFVSSISLSRNWKWNKGWEISTATEFYPRQRAQVFPIVC